MCDTQLLQQPQLASLNTRMACIPFGIDTATCAGVGTAADGSPALAVLAVAFVVAVGAVVAVESVAGVCCAEHATNASALSARAVRCASMSSWVRVAPERRD